MTLYVSGSTLALAKFFPVEPLRRSLVLCLALSYAPFVVDTAASGQLSAVSFFALLMVLREDDLDHRLRRGLALSACLFKPTLPVLLLPMVLVTRRWRTFFGLRDGCGGPLLSNRRVRRFRHMACLLPFDSLLRQPCVWTPGLVDSYSQQVCRLVVVLRTCPRGTFANWSCHLLHNCLLRTSRAPVVLVEVFRRRQPLQQSLVGGNHYLDAASECLRAHL